MAGMMGAGTMPPRQSAAPAAARQGPSVRMAEGPPDTQTVTVEVTTDGGHTPPRASNRSTRSNGSNRPSNASNRSNRRSDASRTSGRSSRSRMSDRSSFSGLGNAANLERVDIGQAWNLPEDEINPRDLRKLRKVLAGCVLATVIGFGIGGAGIGMQTPVREGMIAGGFAIIPMVVWLSFCRCLPFLAPRPRPAELRIWARALFKDLHQPLRFSSMKVIRIKGEKPILKCLGDVHDIQKGVAVLRIQKNCSCCLKEYEPEDRVAVLLCGHIFCEGCLGDWVVSGKKAGSMCPICRFDFTVDSVDPSQIAEGES